MAINCLASPVAGRPTRRMRLSCSSESSGMSEKSICKSGICLTFLAARLPGADDADGFLAIARPIDFASDATRSSKDPPATISKLLFPLARSENHHALTLSGTLMTGILMRAFQTFPEVVHLSINRSTAGFRNVSPHWLQTSARMFLNRNNRPPHRWTCSIVLRFSGALQNGQDFMFTSLSVSANWSIILDPVGKWSPEWLSSREWTRLRATAPSSW